VIALSWLVACEDPTCVVPDGGLGALTAIDEANRDARPEAPTPAYLAAEDGLPLAYREWVPAGWDGTGAVALFVPGSSAHSGQYTAIGAGLAARGVYTRIVDVRGHGLSVCDEAGCGSPEDVGRAPADDGRTWVGRVGDSADADQIVRDLAQHLADLASAWPEASLHAGGHSSGGGMVSRWVERGGAALLHSVGLVAPYNHPEQPQVRSEVLLDCPDLAGTSYAQLDLGDLGAALRGEPHRFVLRLVKEPELADPLDTLAYTWTTTQGIATSDASAFWGAYSVPVLLVAGSEDALLDPGRSADEVSRAAVGSFVELADTSHVGLAWSDEVAEALALHFLASP
jgi:alpha-beta hydrolase superfamily lysophospholipase